MRLGRWMGACLALLAVTAQAQAALPVAQGYGQVRAFFFEGSGLPISGVRVLEGDSILATSDREGMIVVSMPAGSYVLRFELPGGPSFATAQPIPVVRGQETEFLVTVAVDGAPRFDVEAPAGPMVTETTTVATPEGLVQGRITSEEGGAPVLGARVFVRGTGRTARSDEEGRFEILLPTGDRELTIIHPQFSTRTVSGMAVRTQSNPQVQVRLEAKSAQLAEMVITAPRIEGSAIAVLQERQNSGSVADVLGADQMSKSGDSDAASALSRVTGITIVGGRYIYVRGLGERYSSTLLNDSNLPSPDPERRVVPLDLFPTNAIAGLVVQKSYSADVPGEFGGGLVKIRTKDIPEELTLSLSLSVGANSVSTMRQGLVYDGGGTDWLGFGAGHRALPKPFAEAASRARIDPYVPLLQEDGFTSGQRERLAEMLDPNFGSRQRTLPPGFRVSSEAGGRFDLFGVGAGAYISTNFNNTWSITDNAFRTYEVDAGTGDLRERKSQRIITGTNEVSLSVLGALSVDLCEGHELALTLGVFRISSNSAAETTGFDDDRGADVLKSRLTWSERMVVTNQLRGRHQLSEAWGLQLDWRYQLAFATLDQPNRRSLRYEQQPDGRLRLDPDGTERFYSDLFDLNHDVAADVMMPMQLFGSLDSTLKGGLALQVKDRQVNVRRFTYKRPGLRDPAETERVEYLGPDRVFSADTLEPGLQELEESTRSDDNYVGGQSVLGAYLMGDFAVLQELTVQAGLRVEHSKQTIESQPLPGSERTAFDPASLSAVDLLPSVTATWGFIERMQLRAGLARTVNRPSFRELSPAAYIDLARSREFRGNPELERAQILHCDLRWEWYPAEGESVSVAAFAKLFDRPIENTLSGGANAVARPINTQSARNLGLELEARKTFGFVGPAFEDIYVAGNLTLVSSQVTIGEAESILTSDRRALQGQSPYVFNAQVGYDNAALGTSMSLLFNVFARRINDVGVEGLPDIFEESRPELNFVARQRWQRFSFGLKVKNILNNRFRLTQTEPNAAGAVRDVEQYCRGVEFAVSIAADLD